MMSDHVSAPPAGVERPRPGRAIHLSRSARCVLEAMRESEANGEPPITQAALAERVGLSQTAVRHHIVSLARCGLAWHRPRKHRAFGLTDAGLAFTVAR